MRIGKKEIGLGKPVYIIAEAGVNHNGQLAIAKELVRAAKRTGADCVKFQTFRAETLVTAASPKADYQMKTTDPAESQLAMLKKLELSFEDHKELINLCQSEGIQFLSTPYSIEDADFLAELGVDAFKVASGQLVENYFLKYLARKGLPLIVSTGMATLAEVAGAVQVIKAAGNDQICMLQCTTNYPADAAEANLAVIPALREALGMPIGYSDHVPGNNCSIASVAMGAVLIEKHFTLDTSMEGPDHSSSLNEADFSRLVKSIREVESAIGSSVKTPSAAEKRNAVGMRRSVVTGRDLKAGETISMESLSFKRPATGMPTGELGKILGKKLKTDLPKDTQIKFEHIVW